MNTKIWLVISLILALSMFGGMAHAADGEGEGDRLVEQCKSAITFSGPLAPEPMVAMNMGFYFGLFAR